MPPPWPMDHMRHRGPALALGAIALAAGLGLAGPAAALVLDDADATVEASATAGGYEAEITLLNTGDAPITLPSTLEVSEDCTLTVGRTAIPPNRSSAVTLTIPEACFPDGTTEIQAELDPSVQAITITAPEPPDLSDWTPLWVGLVAGVLVALGMLSWCASRLLNAEPALEPIDSTGGTTEQSPAYDTAKNLIDAKLDELGEPPFDWKPLRRVPIRANRPLQGFDSTWSLQDSVVSTATVGVTGVLALLSSTDLLTAILGEEPSPTVAVMAVSGLVNVAVIGIAAALVRLLGGSGVTVRAMMTGCILVVLAGVAQVVTVGVGAAVIFDEIPWLVATVAAATVLLAVLVVLQTGRGIKQMLATGVRDDLPAIPREARTAWRTHRAWDKAHLALQLRSDYAAWIASPPDQGITAARTTEPPMLTAPPEQRRRAVLP